VKIEVAVALVAKSEAKVGEMGAGVEAQSLECSSADGWTE
jgi:hypothetical protein